jgi:hypothetical protein
MNDVMGNVVWGRFHHTGPVTPPKEERFAFLRTYKPLLKRARGTPYYEDIRELLGYWLRQKKIERLLAAQNLRLYEAARERDCLLAAARKKEE